MTAPYFLATKLAAFDGRACGDYMMSHDIEDLVAVIDGRAEICLEVQNSDETVRSHLADRFQTLLQSTRFLAAVPGHLPGDAASQARLPLVIDRITAISNLS